jgi:hypothetical protein
VPACIERAVAEDAAFGGELVQVAEAVEVMTR